MSDSSLVSQPSRAEASPEYLTGRLPFSVAVGLTTVVSLPLAVYLGHYVLPVWAAFIVWAEYFTLGGKPTALLKIYPNFLFGCAWTGAGTLLFVWLKSLGLVQDPTANTFLALSVAYGLTFGSVIKVLSFGWFFANEPLPLFNGLTLVVAVFFTGTAWPLSQDPYLIVLASALTTAVAGIAGGALGVLNVALTFPRPTNITRR